MEILKLLASAETSSDLQHHEQQCHVDILGATGMADLATGHIAVYRLKYLNDAESMVPAKAQFALWARRAIVRRGLKLSPEKVAWEALTKWIDDVCEVCDGLKYQQMKGTPTLTDRACISCGGTGLKKVFGGRGKAQIILDVMGKADRIVDGLTVHIGYKLGKRNT